MAVLTAVILLHLLIGFLVVATSRLQRVRLPAQFLTVTFLPPSAAVAAPSGGSSKPAHAARKISPIPTPSAHSDTEEQTNAITVPGVDWATAAEDAARSRADQPNTSPRNLAGASQAELDRAGGLATPPQLQPKAGDSERAEGGLVLTWVNDKCYWTTQGIAPGLMAQTRKVCKDPPKPETELFKDMGKQLDARDSAPEP